MARLGRPARIIGTALILAGVVMVLAFRGTDADSMAALGTGLGIFGAAMILRTIRG